MKNLLIVLRHSACPSEITQTIDSIFKNGLEMKVLKNKRRLD